jgi:osmotically-inducible protein OsmY
MKKLFAIMFLVGSVATLRADYDEGCPNQYYYSQGYGDENAYPSYDMQSMYGQPNQYQGQDNQGYRFGQQSQGMMQGYQGPGNPEENKMMFNRQNYQDQQGSRWGQDGQGSSYGQNRGTSYGQDQGSRYGQQSQGFSGQEQGNDQKLNSDIRDSLRSRFSDKYSNVNASANNGTVTLTGTVATQEDKNDLDKKIRDFKGVRNVNNQVMVQPNQQQQQQPQGNRY